MKSKDEVPEGEKTVVKTEIKTIKEKTKLEIKNEIVIITLGIPINFNGEIIEKLELDFNSLTGVDICEAESEALGKFYTPLPDTNYSTAYQGAIAAKASGLPFEAILEIKSKDFKTITECTKGFLLG
ncbi:phage tail assembly protein [Psychrilyobacter atlanticus]|uniref:phage tail assembly protein n=1 Tax=Psychrilyobacter atlanticus TaxID=271091 RepID=UPI0003FBEBF6|nr:phage tail assembly protein [Psychrilyobacter atlanticus]